MTAKTKVTVFKGGTKEKTMPISKLVIPDLWPIAEAIRNKDRIHDRAACADAILNCWHIAGALKAHILLH